MGVSSLSGQEAVEGSLRGRSRGCQCCEQMWRVAEQKAETSSTSQMWTQLSWEANRRHLVRKNETEEKCAAGICLISDFLGTTGLCREELLREHKGLVKIWICHFFMEATSTGCRSPVVSNLRAQPPECPMLYIKDGMVFCPSESLWEK